MSNRALNWAFQAPLPSTQKFVLVVLADLADEEDSCYPGQPRIAQSIGGNERTVRRALVELEASGYIVREHRHRSNGSRRSDRYVLRVGWLPPTCG